MHHRRGPVGAGTEQPSPAGPAVESTKTPRYLKQPNRPELVSSETSKQIRRDLAEREPGKILPTTQSTIVQTQIGARNRQSQHSYKA
jgi:hypothetical protein